MRFHAALSASLNLCCTCWTQSRPVTNNRAKTSGSVSSLAASNSFRASAFRRWFQGIPFSSHQWKCLAVRNISLYNDRASARCDAYRVALAAFGIQMCGGILNNSDLLRTIRLSSSFLSLGVRAGHQCLQWQSLLIPVPLPRPEHPPLTTTLMMDEQELYSTVLLRTKRASILVLLMSSSVDTTLPHTSRSTQTWYDAQTEDLPQYPVLL